MHRPHAPSIDFFLPNHLQPLIDSLLVSSYVLVHQRIIPETILYLLL